MSERELFESGPLVRMRLSVSRAVFRLGPAWSVIAGAVAGGALRPDADALMRVLTAAVLADLAWGAIRQVVPVNPVAVPVPVAALDSADLLPYAQPGAPFARWLAALTPAQPVDIGQHAGGGTLGAWQGVLIVITLAFVLSVLLGWPAVMLTMCALVTIWVAAALARRGDQPALAFALLDVGWPWLLGLSLTTGLLTGDSSLAGAGPGLWSALHPGLLLALAFTVLQWGHYRSQPRAGGASAGRLLVWCGQFSVLAVLIVLQSPWAVGCVAALMAVPSFWLARRTGAAGDDAGLGRGPLAWWWAASLVAAVAVR